MSLTPQRQSSVCIESVLKLRLLRLPVLRALEYQLQLGSWFVRRKCPTKVGTLTPFLDDEFHRPLQTHARTDRYPFCHRRRISDRHVAGRIAGSTWISC